MSVNFFKNGTLTKIARGLKDAAVTITNNLLATESGTALDAVQGKVLDDKITEVNNSLTYSENEIVCGKFIDKPIYRKLINTTTPSQIDIATNLDVVLENLESLIKLSIIVKNEDGYKYFGSSFINTANHIISVWINPSNQLRMYVNSDYFKSKPCIVIAEYTKKD